MSFMRNLTSFIKRKKVNKMDYYLLSEDRNISHPLSLQNYSQSKEHRDIVINEGISLQTKLVFYIKKKILFQSNHIFSDKVKEKIEGFEPELNFHAIFVTSKDMKSQYAYWELDPKSIKVINIEKVKNVLDFNFKKEDLDGYAMLLGKYEKTEHIIIREDLAESIMRCYPLSMKFKRITIV